MELISGGVRQVMGVRHGVRATMMQVLEVQKYGRETRTVTPLEDPTVPNSTNRIVRSAVRSAKNPAGPPTVASVIKKPKPRQPPSTSHREMRSSTTWGQYIRSQGGRLRDPVYPASTGRKQVQKKKKTTKTPAMRTTTNTTKIPSPFQPWDVQL